MPRVLFQQPVQPGIRRLALGFRKIVGSKWDPGLNLPFDPVAAKLGEKLKLKVIVMNGKPLSNLSNFLRGKAYKGTVIG